ncbi:sigma-E factor negative regulatory protein [Pseudomonas sp. NCCP-436]|uniref:sigma-E factor negative regulatory protein n=1 Tax=Pseudomonas sp. NCCP-436 TaxID=2842481 RepID=UPI001C817A2A|nr:RseA family anti-sigma factor [Pseudomonas sp. NCCP-436]GIZ11140.1 sigma factor AlgU negative regulatory protein [Pseudomonas sp. NCCP-436]
MSRETLRESLSAVMDNEADELELRRVLAASEDDELRSTWSRYQLARAAMHRELLVPQLDIASAVSAALADEAVPVRKTPVWRQVGRVAVAASVTVAVLAGVRFYNQDEFSGVQLAQQDVAPVISAPQVQGPALLAGYSRTAEEADQAAEKGSLSWHEHRLPDYLRQHAQQGVVGASESALPYARAASLENR